MTTNRAGPRETIRDNPRGAKGVFTPALRAVFTGETRTTRSYVCETCVCLRVFVVARRAILNEPMRMPPTDSVETLGRGNERVAVNRAITANLYRQLRHALRVYVLGKNAARAKARHRWA